RRSVSPVFDKLTPGHLCAFSIAPAFREGQGGVTHELRVDVFADLPQRGRERGAQTAGGRRAEVSDESRSLLAHFLDGQLDARFLALFAIVEHGDDPCDLDALRITCGVVVGAVVGKLLHESESITR